MVSHRFVGRVIVMRHGHAEPYRADDFSRSLTAQGLEQARRSATALHDLGVRPSLVITSPAARTRQTAQALLQVLAVPAESLREDSRLYLADVATLERILAEQAAAQADAELILVGHNPGLSMLAGCELEPADFRILASYSRDAGAANARAM